MKPGFLDFDTNQKIPGKYLLFDRWTTLSPRLQFLLNPTSTVSCIIQIEVQKCPFQMDLGAVES
jgi:hypothetical protein